MLDSSGSDRFLIRGKFIDPSALTIFAVSAILSGERSNLPLDPTDQIEGISDREYDIIRPHDEACI
jgi:hypothetical protein